MSKNLREAKQKRNKSRREIVKDKKVYKIDDDLREIKKKEIEEMKARRKRA